ncbi:hypothetical protein D3C77_812980 [compost metagenome]
MLVLHANDPHDYFITIGACRSVEAKFSVSVDALMTASIVGVRENLREKAWPERFGMDLLIFDDK